MGLRLIKLDSPTIIGRRTALGWRSTAAKPNSPAKPLVNFTGLELFRALIVDDRGDLEPWRALAVVLMGATVNWLIDAEAASLLSLLQQPHSYELIDKIRTKAPRLALETQLVAVFAELINTIWVRSIKD